MKSEYEIGYDKGVKDTQNIVVDSLKYLLESSKPKEDTSALKVENGDKTFKLIEKDQEIKELQDKNRLLCILSLVCAVIAISTVGYLALSLHPSPKIVCDLCPNCNQTNTTCQLCQPCIDTVCVDKVCNCTPTVDFNITRFYVINLITNVSRNFSYSNYTNVTLNSNMTFNIQHIIVF